MVDLHPLNYGEPTSPYRVIKKAKVYVQYYPSSASYVQSVNHFSLYHKIRLRTTFLMVYQTYQFNIPQNCSYESVDIYPTASQI